MKNNGSNLYLFKQFFKTTLSKNRTNREKYAYIDTTKSNVFKDINKIQKKVSYNFTLHPFKYLIVCLVTWFISIETYNLINAIYYLLEHKQLIDINTKIITNYIPNTVTILFILMNIVIQTYNQKKYNASINTEEYYKYSYDETRLLNILNSWVVNTRTNKIMKVYQLIDIRKSTHDILYFKSEDFYFFEEILTNYTEEMNYHSPTNLEIKIIREKAQEIPNWTYSDMKNYLNIIDKLEKIRYKEKLIKTTKKYDIDRNISKENLDDYKLLQDTLQKEYDALNKDIEKHSINNL